MKKVLFIGNGLNNLSNQYSWDDLINELIFELKVEDIITDRGKPFPLLYEEIYLKTQNVKELNLKKLIAERTKKVVLNKEIHNRLANLKITDILTTNYDLCIERSILREHNISNNEGVVNETKYSLFRYHRVKGVKVWHIHGSDVHPNSITLGYDHYSGYLHQMREYVISGTTGLYRNLELNSISRRLRENQFHINSWIDHFFSSDIHIIGFNLRFVEMHLWWLLTYRSRAIHEGKINVKNNIYYYLPSGYHDSNMSQLSLLETNGVKLRVINKAKDDLGYYKKVFNELESIFT